MESKLMDLVKAMHAKFGLENIKGVVHLTKEEKEFRSVAMLEELNEYIAADTLVDQYDALLDLIVFAVGTLERHGFPLLAGFEKVMEANMAKELGQNGEKRGGFKRDLVKPEGWTAPEAGTAIHGDFKDKFIRAEIIEWTKLLESGSYGSAREKGWVRTEGKEYIVKDGDVIEFKI